MPTTQPIAIHKIIIFIVFMYVVYDDVFVGGYGYPWLEFKNEVPPVSCSYSGRDQAFGCKVQVYCCAHPEPTSTSQCQDWNGQYSEKNYAKKTQIY